MFWEIGPGTVFGPELATYSVLVRLDSIGSEVVPKKVSFCISFVFAVLLKIRPFPAPDKRGLSQDPSL